MNKKIKDGLHTEFYENNQKKNPNLNKKIEELDKLIKQWKFTL